MDEFEKLIKKIEKKEKTWEYTLNGKRLKFWSVPKTTGDFLYFISKLTKAKTILELGCSVGFSTLFFAKAAKENNGHVYTTELINQKIKLAKKHFLKAKLEKYITLYKGDISESIKNWNKKIDIIFLDADKRNYINYYKKLFPFLKKGGLIIADNAKSHKNLMKDFVKLAKKDNEINTLLSMDSGLFLVYKK